MVSISAGALLVAAGAVLFGFLGVAHAVLTFRSSPAGGPMTPCAAEVRVALTQVGGVGMAPDLRSTLWRTYVGMNLSHALGVVIASGATLWLATSGGELFTAWPVRVGVLVVPAIYLGLSLRYWFAKPTQAIALGSALIYAGVLADILG